MSRSVFPAILGLGLVACSTAAAREPTRVEDRAGPVVSALDRTLVVGTLIEATIQAPPAGRGPASGATVAAAVSADVRNARRWVVIPAGSPVELRVARRQSATVTLEVRSVTVRGRPYPVRVATTVPAVTPGMRVFFVLPEGLTVGPK